MKKIDKKCNLSTSYKKWEEDLEKKKEPHPKYSSSKFKYYKDIVMQLYACQDGLCAYTERELCDENLFTADKWKDGKYIGTFDPAGRFGQLEHFDESLKAKNKDNTGIKDWLWDNLFMVDSDINRRKNQQAVDDILKPDRPDYNPFELLEYNRELHVFIPHSSLEEDRSERVKTMIDTLGINLVYSIRDKYLEEKIRFARLEESSSLSEIHPKQFPTSFEMCVRLIEQEEKSI